MYNNFRYPVGVDLQTAPERHLKAQVEFSTQLILYLILLSLPAEDFASQF